MIFIATLNNSKAKAKKINNLEIKAPNSRNNTINIKKVDKIRLNESKTNFNIYEIKKKEKHFLRKKSFYISFFTITTTIIALIFLDNNFYVNILITILSLALSYIIALLE